MIVMDYNTLNKGAYTDIIKNLKENLKYKKIKGMIRNRIFT